MSIVAQVVPLGSRKQDCLSHDGILIHFGFGVLGIITEFVDHSPNTVSWVAAQFGEKAAHLLDDAPSDKVKRVHCKLSRAVQMLKVGDLACKPVHGLLLAKAAWRKILLGDELVGMVLAAAAKDLSDLLVLAGIVCVALVCFFQCLVVGV